MQVVDWQPAFQRNAREAPKNSMTRVLPDVPT